MADFSGRFFAANSVFLNMLGYAESELYQLTIIDVTYEEDRKANLELVRELVEGKRNHFELEKRLCRTDGTLLWVRTNVALVPGLGGVAPFWFAIVEDITERKRVEEKLSLQIEVLQKIPAVAWTVTLDGRCDFVNQFFLDATGMSREYVQSHPNEWNKSGDAPPPLLSGLPPQDRQRGASLFWRGIRTGEGWAFEAQHFHASDGTYHWYFDRAVPLRDSQGKIVRFVGTCTDIDPLKRVQENLRESETRLQTFFENSPSLIFLKDRQGRYLYVNKEFKRAFLNTQQVSGRTDNELFPSEQAAAFEANDRRVLEAGVPMEFEEVALQKDGQHTSIVHKFPLFNAEGGICAIGGIATDITERKQEESARRYSEERYRVVVETANDAVISTDESGAIQFASPATTRVFGYDPRELIGKPLTALLPEFMRKLHQNGFRRHADNGQRPISWHGAELTGLHKDGRELPVEVSLGELTRNGHRVFTGFIRDISEWKAAQEALQKTRAELARVSKLTTMGELAASIAHEVNQPLTAVTNNSNACLRLLADQNLKAEVLRQALEEIVADGNRASTVIARIRSFIMKEPTEKNALDINEVIQEVLALTGRELDENRVLLGRQLTNDLPLVLGDRVQLQQVLLNLITNGIEAMTAVANRPRLLWVESRVGNDGNVLVAVRDSGTGLSVDVDRIFTPFFTTKANGMGMGLSISRSLVEGHGGRLWAKPNAPHGAVFYFTLPVA